MVKKLIKHLTELRYADGGRGISEACLCDSGKFVVLRERNIVCESVSETCSLLPGDRVHRSSFTMPRNREYSTQGTNEGDSLFHRKLPDWTLEIDSTSRCLTTSSGIFFLFWRKANSIFHSLENNFSNIECLIRRNFRYFRSEGHWQGGKELANQEVIPRSRTTRKVDVRGESQKQNWQSSTTHFICDREPNFLVNLFLFTRSLNRLVPLI